MFRWFSVVGLRVACVGVCVGMLPLFVECVLRLLCVCRCCDMVMITRCCCLWCLFVLRYAVDCVMRLFWCCCVDLYVFGCVVRLSVAGCVVVPCM